APVPPAPVPPIPVPPVPSGSGGVVPRIRLQPAVAPSRAATAARPSRVVTITSPAARPPPRIRMPRVSRQKHSAAAPLVIKNRATSVRAGNLARRHVDAGPRGGRRRIDASVLRGALGCLYAVLAP